jgi:phosphatidylglycerol:prolipoprotein diacylglycerol transferase
MSTFWVWWQQLPAKINPVVFEFGWFRVQYYGLMYIVAFTVTYALVRYRLKRENIQFAVSVNHVNDLMTFMIIGVIIGGRLGYVLFYNFSYYIHHPFEIFLPFEFSNGITFTGLSGMSFHGGLLGVILSAWLYTKKNSLSFWDMADLFAPAIPLGYTFGRIGNFINGELYGRVTSSPIGMYFPLAPGPNPRHPSQLYEAFFEGIFLFAVLWPMRKIPFPKGTILAFYLIGYGLVRFFIEYFRQPDAHLGFVWMSFSLGQILSGSMILGGVFLSVYVHRRKT